MWQADFMSKISGDFSFQNNDKKYYYRLRYRKKLFHHALTLDSGALILIYFHLSSVALQPCYIGYVKWVSNCEKLISVQNKVHLSLINTVL